MQTSSSVKEFFKQMFSDVSECVLQGFFFTMLLFGALVHWASLGSVVQGNILGFGFQLSAVLFFAVAGALRSLKRVRAFSATVYRLFHFLLSGASLYLCFFVLWPNLSVALSEQKADSLASGAVNWAHVILAYVFYLAAYFSVIGIRTAQKRAREKHALEQQAYESMLEKRKQK